MPTENKDGRSHEFGSPQSSQNTTAEVWIDHNTMDFANLLVAAPKLVAFLKVFMKATNEPDAARREAKLLVAQELANEALKHTPDVPVPQEVDAIKEIARLVALVDRFRANERRLINALFDAKQRLTIEPSATDQPEILPSGPTYTDGIREAARLIELWMKNEQVTRSFNGIENRDATRILFFMPDRLRDCANANSLPPSWKHPEEESEVPGPITRTERALFQLMLRTTDDQRSLAPALLPTTELDAASRAFEASEHYLRSESSAARTADWRIWIDAWSMRAEKAQNNAAIERQVHMDEIDAARVGEKFIHDKIAELGNEAKELRYADRDMTAQIPRVKWTALFDRNDRLRAAYLLNRDCMNWCQVTLVSVI